MKMTQIDKPPLNELAHFGILGMKWGHRKQEESSAIKTKVQKPTYYDRAKADYIDRGFSKVDSEALAKRKTLIRNAALVAGGVTVAVGAAFIARHFYIENKDKTLKIGEKAFHIARGEVKDLEPGRSLYVTIDQADRFAYRFRLNNPKEVDRIERTFQLAKEIKLPSPKKSAALYGEFLKDPNNEQVVKEVFGKLKTTPNYQNFVTYGPYFSKGESWHAFASNNPAGESIWNGYKEFLINKGYQGVLDANDRARENGFNVERPAILFDAASHLKEVGRTSLGKEVSTAKALIPTIRELGSLNTAGYLGAIAGVTGISVYNNSEALNSYRKVYPNSKKTNSEILKLMKSNPEFTLEIYNKVVKLEGESS